MWMSPNISWYVDRNRVVAVVGASRNREKWGYKLYRFFKGYYVRVYPVNPKAELVDGDKAYPNLRELPEIPDFVDVVVPPNVTMAVLEEASSLGVKRIWLQPGSEDEGVLKRCSELGLDCVYGKCLMETIMSFRGSGRSPTKLI